LLSLEDYSCEVAIPEAKQACGLIREVLRAQLRNGRKLLIEAGFDSLNRLPVVTSFSKIFLSAHHPDSSTTYLNSALRRTPVSRTLCAILEPAAQPFLAVFLVPFQRPRPTGHFCPVQNN